jgi:2-isopropylmalate synthase
MDDHVRIFDTTLRDGEQSPGCSMTGEEKLRIARTLAELGVDVIEAGFPAASPGDFESVAAVAKEIRGPVVCALARCIRKDIDGAWAALAEAANPRLHVFLATSAIHREHKLQMAREEIVRLAAESVRHARTLCDDVEFSPEDASRTEFDFLAEVVQAAVDAGAKTINIPDTVGYTTPQEYYETIAHLRRSVRGIEKITLSAHCHDDLGMAVANSLAAVRAGARQVECTINGIGERAGNCSMEEIVMALRVRQPLYGVDTRIRAERLYPACRLVSTITGMPIPRNKAVTGENAFAHESGIHQHGMLRHASTYEIMRPQDVGLSRSHLVLGKHSGRHAFRERVRELGFELDEREFDQVFARFKALADRKKELFDGDVEALVLDTGTGTEGPWSLVRLRTESATGESARADVELAHTDGRRISINDSGDGPIDAALGAIARAIALPVRLCKFEVRSVSEGEDAQGEALVTVEFEGRAYRGSSVSTDIVESGVRAFLEVVNRIEASRQSGQRLRWAVG